MNTFVVDQGDYSIVPEGSYIYRGQTDAFDITQDRAILRRNVFEEENTFFGLEPESTTRNYGITTKLRVNADLRLLNINNRSAYNKLRSSMIRMGNEAALDALDSAYVLEDDEVKRDSDAKLDNRVLSFICDHTDYDGYIQPEMNKPTYDGGGFMHSEMGVCKSGLPKITQFMGSEAIPPAQGMSYQEIKRDNTMRKMRQGLKKKPAALEVRPTLTRPTRLEF